MILRDHSLTTRDQRPKSNRRRNRVSTRAADHPLRPPVEALRRHYEALGVVGKQCGSRPRAR